MKELTVETSAGDPRFLEIVRKTVADGMRSVDTKGAAADTSTAFILDLNPLKPTTAAVPADQRADGAADDRDEDDET